MFQHGADSARRPFRAQGDGTAAFVLKGVHFLLHHVGGLSHRTLEQFGVFKYRGADLPESMGRAHPAHDIFHHVPLVTPFREYILGSSDRFGDKSHKY